MNQDFYIFLFYTNNIKQIFSPGFRPGQYALSFNHLSNLCDRIEDLSTKCYNAFSGILAPD